MINVEEMINNYVSSENEMISNLANISSILYNNLEDINWLGFYLLGDDNKLFLGPFQGLAAVSEINLNSGVCGKSSQNKETIVVDDVHCFEGHIACDIRSKSEIVIPIINKDGSLYGVLDVDSPIQSRFKNVEKELLEKAVTIIEEILVNKK